MPAWLSKPLAKRMGLPDDATIIRLGPIPKGTPVNLLANIDPGITLDLVKLVDFVALAIKLNTALRDIREYNLNDTAAAARLRRLVPDLLKVSKCPDFVADGGHLFGTQLADDDKRALIAYLKRL